MTELLNPVFIFGPGFTGHAFAQIWAGPVFGSLRNPAKTAELAAKNILPVPLNDAEQVVERLRGAHLIVAAPPTDQGCPGLAHLADMTPSAKSVTYLSTTGVYGDLSGGWAFEWSPVNPASVRGRRRVSAENAWRAVRPDLKIARLPGIYGAGRSVLDRLRAGRASRIVKPGHVFSRIHVDDLAAGLAALVQSEASGVFHFCDEEAAPPQDVTAFGADLLGVPVPDAIDYAQADLSEMARSFYSECKRVSNARAKAALGWRPRFRTYREGLTSIRDAGG